MPDYTQRNGRTRFVYYVRVSGRKVPFATPGWPDPPQRKRSSKILPNGKYDRNRPLTVRQMVDHRQTHSGKKNVGGVVNQAHALFPICHPHEVRQSKSKRMDRNPGWIGGGAFTPVKNPFAKEGIDAWEMTKKI